MNILVVALACQPEPVEQIQPPIGLQLVLHSEPIPRSKSMECVSEDLNNCGLLHAGVIRATRNWVGWPIPPFRFNKDGSSACARTR